MMYIDPKDQPAHPDWNPTYRAAWEERRKLRLQETEVKLAIQQMEMFLQMYEKLEPQKPPAEPQVTITASSSNESGWANVAGSNVRSSF